MKVQTSGRAAATPVWIVSKQVVKTKIMYIYVCLCIRVDLRGEEQEFCSGTVFFGLRHSAPQRTSTGTLEFEREKEG